MAQKTVADGASEVTLPQYVEWRGNRLWYRRAFPKDLWPVVGKGRAFAQSLRTDSPHEAMRSRPEAERAFFAAVDRARSELAQQQAVRPSLTKDAAISIAVEWFLAGLERGDDWRKPMDPDELEQAFELSSDRML